MHAGRIIFKTTEMFLFEFQIQWCPNFFQFLDTKQAISVMIDEGLQSKFGG